jgi:hypothetical protein
MTSDLQPKKEVKFILAKSAPKVETRASTTEDEKLTKIISSTYTNRYT